MVIEVMCDKGASFSGQARETQLQLYSYTGVEILELAHMCRFSIEQNVNGPSHVRFHTASVQVPHGG